MAHPTAGAEAGIPDPPHDPRADAPRDAAGNPGPHADAPRDAAGSPGSRSPRPALPRGFRPQAVIFDMDGLMVDSEPVWERTWGPALARYGLTLRPGLLDKTMGSSRERIKRLFAEAYDGDPNAQLAVEDHYEIGARLFMASGAPMKPGLDELLAWLAGEGVPCAVASGSERRVVEANLRHAGVRERFGAVVTGDDGYPSKPAPDVFLAAARLLGADPVRTVVLEDSPSGVRAAAAGGFVPVMVPDLARPTDELRALCAAVCTDLLEVRDLLAAAARP